MRFTQFSADANVNARISEQIRQREEELVEVALKLAKARGKRKDSKERQLRNVQQVAEQASSFRVVELFMRYQAARGEIEKDWAEKMIQELQGLNEIATAIARAVGVQDKSAIRQIHVELVALTLGYAVRWHVWQVK